MDKLEWLIEPAQWPKKLQSQGRSVAICIGNFDGVHCGHRELIAKARGLAQEQKGSSAVLTFNPHPVSVLQPDHPHQRLFDFEDQRKVFEQLGVGFVLVHPFDRAFSERSPEDFFKYLILDLIKPSEIIVGEDFRFGHRRQGDVQLLKKLAEAHQIKVHAVSPVLHHGDKVSTSRIRKSLLDHNPVLARELLQRPYYMKGIVEKGEQRGRQLGFPTANIRPSLEFMPHEGVYVTACCVQNQRLISITNIGRNKTFVSGDHQPIKVESFILQESQLLDSEHGGLYGLEMRVELLEWVREEKKFNSFDELKQQIARDVEVARKWHQSNP